MENKLNIDYKLVKRRNKYGEYRIICYWDNVIYPEGDYYTDDWEDATDTFKAMAKQYDKPVFIYDKKPIQWRTW